MHIFAVTPLSEASPSSRLGIVPDCENISELLEQRYDLLSSNTEVGEHVVSHMAFSDSSVPISDTRDTSSNVDIAISLTDSETEQEAKELDSDSQSVEVKLA